jgi:hypothetical protein
MTKLELAVVVLSAFGGGVVTTIALNSRVAPAFAQDAPTAKTGEPAAKPADPAAKPADPAAKPAEPAAAPADPAAKPADAAPAVPAAPPVVVRANRFEIVDAAGKARASIDIDAMGVPRFMSSDADGTWFPDFHSMPSPAKMKSVNDECAALYKKPELDVKTVEVQHILISFDRKTGPNSNRTLEEAASLAYDILERVKAGGNFDTLVKAYSNDGGPGKYTMLSEGNTDQEKLTFKRTDMVAAFGDIGWRLAVGEVGIATYDATKSKFGFHIIKRLK